MGSGLILLVIVGAWLAVLVPLGLRSSSGRPTSTLSAALPESGREPARVLSRRTRPVARVVEPPAPVVVADPVVDEPVRVRARSAAPRRPAPRAAAPRAAAPRVAAPVRRRRRLLGLLAVLALAALVAGLVGPRVLLPVAGALAGLLLALVHLRRASARRARLRTALRRREALAREAAAREAAEDLALERERAEREQQERLVEAARAAFVGAVDGLPSRMPPRPAPPVREQEVVGQEVPAQAGSPWQPVPVPPPMYVRHRAAQAAPARPRQAPPAQAPAAEELPLEHRWVSGGW